MGRNDFPFTPVAGIQTGERCVVVMYCNNLTASGALRSPEEDLSGNLHGQESSEQMPSESNIGYGHVLVIAVLMRMRDPPRCAVSTHFQT
jgi:hypothetical protein